MSFEPQEYSQEHQDIEKEQIQTPSYPETTTGENSRNLNPERLRFDSFKADTAEVYLTWDNVNFSVPLKK